MRVFIFEIWLCLRSLRLRVIGDIVIAASVLAPDGQGVIGGKVTTSIGHVSRSATIGK